MPYKPLWASLALVALLLAAAPGSLSAQSNVDALDVALTYVDENAAKLGVTRADVEDLVVTSRYRSSHNGVTHVNLNQHYQGLEVFGGHVTVNVALDGSVVFAGGSLVAKLGAAPTGSADLKATEAVEAAAEELKLGRPTDLQRDQQQRARRPSFRTVGSPTRRSRFAWAGSPRAAVCGKPGSS